MQTIRRFALFTFLGTMMLAVTAEDVVARAGGGRSSGSRGSRSYSRPVSPSPMTPSRQYSPSQPYQGPSQQQRRGGLFGGGFGSGLLGGIAGGLLGGMLFRSLGFGGGLGAGGGIGLFDILLLAGIGYLIYRFVKKRSAGAVAGGNTMHMGDYQRQEYRPQSYDQPQGYSQPQTYAEPERYEAPGAGGVEGLAHIRQMDPSFDERRFADQVMDIFFRIQGAWMNRDLSGVSSLLTEEMRGLLQQDAAELIREQKTNRLENIAVRNVEVSEAWQEGGQDFITALIYANLLDYTTDDRTGAVISGSKTEPVKFEEYWTFVRPVGNNPWRLSAISQK